jgi:DNA-directed RNA polymerase subunit H (RpoH/RPB5)
MTTTEKKIVRQRLSALQLAESLSNVTEACRRREMSRTQFYEYKRRFQTHGLEGLKDLPPIHKSHTQTTPPKVVEQILERSLQHPMWGCVRLSDQLKLKRVSVSSPTIQKILIQHELVSKHQRLLRLEEKALDEKIPLTPEQAKAIEKTNPCFKERQVESSGPGELLSRTRSRLASSRASARSTCKPWSTPTAPMPSGTCTPASSRNTLPPFFTTTCSPSTKNGAFP